MLVGGEGVEVFGVIKDWGAGEGVTGFHVMPVGLDVLTEKGFLLAEVDVSKETGGYEIGHGVLVSYKKLSTVGEIAIYFIQDLAE